MSAETVMDRPRVVTAMVTPFGRDGYVNFDGAQQLASHLVNNGSDGLVLAGTTGESPVLTVDDQLELFDVVREAVGDEVHLIGGTGSNNTAEAVELSEEAENRGAVDQLLVVSPYYNRPSQYGILDYYQKIRSKTEMPIILYNIPVRTGRLVVKDTIRSLVDQGVVSGLKDATGDTGMAAELHEEFGDQLSIYSGDDNLNLDFAKAGAVGAISVASHWAGNEMSQMFTAFFAGDHEKAARIQAALQPSAEFESVHTDAEGVEHETPNPVPAKVMMGQILGADVIGNCLSPMVVPPEEIEYLRRRSVTLRAELAEAMACI